MISSDHVALATNTLILKLIESLIESGHLSKEAAGSIFDEAIAAHESVGTDVNATVASFLRQIRASELPE